MKIIIRNKFNQETIHYSEPGDDVSYFLGYNMITVKHTMKGLDPVYLYHKNDIKSIRIIK